MTRGLLVVALAALLFPVRGARAQSDDPPRPRLDDAAADTNDWVENLAFAPAHDALARLALIRGDTATAVRERAMAVELRPSDAFLRQQYGGALLVAGRPLDALDQFRRAVALEPYCADPYYGIAAAHDLAGDSTAAAKEYEEYLARAPRRASALRQHAERRLAALRAAGK